MVEFKKLFVFEDMTGFVELVDKMSNDTAMKVANAARISYAKKKNEWDEADKKLSTYLRMNGHTSPFRHTYYTFHIKAPIFTLRQWMKYQVASCWRTYEADGESLQLEIFDHLFDTDKGCSWNEISGRYVNLKPEFYIPNKMRSNVKHGNKQASEELSDDFDHARFKVDMYIDCEKAYKKYEERIEAGVAKEIARMVLPQNIYTEVYWTVSLQAVMHFFEQRMTRDAQYEIRMFANAIYTLIEEDMKKLGIPREALGFE